MQIVNKQDIQSKNVAKAQPLVEASYNFNIWEKRVYTILASLVDKDDPDFKMYRIRIRDIIEFYECNSNDAYERIKEVPESLLSKNKILKIPYITKEGRKRILKTHLITAVTEPDESEGREIDAYIELQFHPSLKPFLLGLKRYLCYDIKNTVGIKSVHSIRIFELLKLYQYKGAHVVSVDELKGILGVQNKHKRYGHFKRIITKAQSDLKKFTDIQFDFSEKKEGRSVKELHFNIEQNTPTDTKRKKHSKRNHFSNEPHPKLEEWWTVLKSWGITKETLARYIQDYSDEHIAIRIHYVQNMPNKDRISNLAGYFHILMQQSSLAEIQQPITKLAAQNKAKKAELAKQKEDRKALTERLKLLKRQQYQKEQTIIDAYFQDFAEERSRILDLLKSDKRTGYKTALSLEENYSKNPMFRGAVHAYMKKDQPQLFGEVAGQFSKILKALESQMNRL